jgi:hypothetical protein
MRNMTRITTELNDTFRSTFVGGGVLVTDGVAAMDCNAKRCLLSAVRMFDQFSDDNDPNGEHDFGVIEIAGDRFFFKIDYYDRSMSGHSPDKADPTITTRVLTIMRADEY